MINPNAQVKQRNVFTVIKTPESFDWNQSMYVQDEFYTTYEVYGRGRVGDDAEIKWRVGDQVSIWLGWSIMLDQPVVRRICKTKRGAK
jgi:hypothetical protein